MYYSNIYIFVRQWFLRFTNLVLNALINCICLTKRNVYVVWYKILGQAGAYVSFGFAVCLRIFKGLFVFYQYIKYFNRPFKRSNGQKCILLKSMNKLKQNINEIEIKICLLLG